MTTMKTMIRMFAFRGSMAGRMLKVQSAEVWSGSPMKAPRTVQIMKSVFGSSIGEVFFLSCNRICLIITIFSWFEHSLYAKPGVPITENMNPGSRNTHATLEKSGHETTWLHYSYDGIVQVASSLASRDPCMLARHLVYPRWNGCATANLKHGVKYR